jgi:hypothetical protein
MGLGGVRNWYKTLKFWVILPEGSSSRTMTLGSTELLTEMSTRKIPEG